jgi:hypothetical protein
MSAWAGQEHSYQEKNCQPPNLNPAGVAGPGRKCDELLCSQYLEEAKLTETAVVESAFVCDFKKNGRLTTFCLCDLKYSSDLENFVGSENDGIEMNYSTKQTFIGEP